jgi:hypothetical protein
VKEDFSWRVSNRNIEGEDLNNREKTERLGRHQTVMTFDVSIQRRQARLQCEELGA